MSSQPSIESSVIATIERNTPIVNHNISSKPSTVHSLPCNIHHDGHAEVDVYFCPTSVSDASSPLSTTTNANESQYEQQLAAQFRGRSLRGKEYSLPVHVAGVVLSPLQPSSAASGSSSSVIKVEASFRSLHDWGHDIDPSEDTLGGSRKGRGKIQRAFDWFELSEAVHDPIEVS